MASRKASKWREILSLVAIISEYMAFTPEHGWFTSMVSRCSLQDICRAQAIDLSPSITFTLTLEITVASFD
jgi:hypothetical protein